MFADTQLKGEYLDGFRVRVSRNGHSLHIGAADSEEKLGGLTSPSGTDADDVEVVPPPAGPS